MRTLTGCASRQRLNLSPGRDSAESKGTAGSRNERTISSEVNSTSKPSARPRNWTLGSAWPTLGSEPEAAHAERAPAGFGLRCQGASFRRRTGKCRQGHETEEEKSSTVLAKSH